MVCVRTSTSGSSRHLTRASSRRPDGTWLHLSERHRSRGTDIGVAVGQQSGEARTAEGPILEIASAAAVRTSRSESPSRLSKGSITASAPATRLPRLLTAFRRTNASGSLQRGNQALATGLPRLSQHSRQSAGETSSWRADRPQPRKRSRSPPSPRQCSRREVEIGE